MKTSRWALLGIFIVFILAVVADLPHNIPLKFNIGPLAVDRIISPPVINLPLLGQRDFQTHLGLDLKGGVQLVLQAQMEQIPESDRSQALQSAKEIIERRVNFFGVSEPVVQTAVSNDQYRIIVELPGLTNVNEAVDLIGQTAQLEFREFTPEATASAVFPTLFNTQATGLTGKDLKSARIDFNQQTSEPVVAFEFTPEGGQKFAELTTRLVDQRLPIFLDEMVLSAPVVQNPITEGNGIISGGFTSDEAKRLALQLSAGALPTPIEVVEQRTIGASLGQESVAKSIRAGAIGLAMVALFMVLYYGFLGFVANLALIMYGLVTLAVFRFIPITLTLPGIAGFILSIGMAVDSNILIFSRFKEEQRKGKPWQIALELAFGRAWDSIRDANITTLLTAAILYNPTNLSFIPISGIVRGFAITLAVGVLVSLFSGIVVSRTLMRVMYPWWLSVRRKVLRQKELV